MRESQQFRLISFGHKQKYFFVIVGEGSKHIRLNKSLDFKEAFLNVDYPPGKRN